MPWRVPDAPGIVAAGDHAHSLVSAPSQLGFLPSWELESLFFRTGEDQRIGLYAATPLLFGVSLGALFESVNTDLAASVAAGGFAVGYAPSDALSIGTTFRFLSSADRSLDGRSVADASLSFRLGSSFALTFLATDLFAGSAVAPSDSVQGLVATAAFRPTGRSDFSLEFGVGANLEARVLAKAALEARIPAVGRLLANVDWQDLRSGTDNLSLSVGLAVDWGRLSIAGGTLHSGNGMGELGGFAALRLGGLAQRGIPPADYVLDLRLPALGVRGIMQLALVVDRLIADPHAQGLLVRMRGASFGMAHAQELRLLFAQLRAHGKHVLCHLESATGSEWYACRAADRIVMEPAGNLRLMGPSMENMQLTELMDRVGIRAEFIRIGEFKSYPEDFAANEMSSSARLVRNELLDDLVGRLTSDTATDLGVEPSVIRARIDNGPYMARGAVQAGLIEAESDEADLTDAIKSVWGEQVNLRDSRPRYVDDRMGRGPRIGVVLVDDTIVDGDSVDVPIVGIHMTGGRTLIQSINRLAADPSVRAIILRVDSGGGAALASEQVWRAVMKAKKKKPVIASIGAIAASGGYYIASAADEIWANPSTITGSIGIFFAKPDAAGLASKLGVRVEQVGRGRRAGAESLFRPFSPDERGALADMIRDGYGLFLQRVAEGRGMTVEAVDAIGRGRVYSGDRALGLNLIDKLGGFQSALVRARELGDLPVDCEVEFLPAREQGIVQMLLGGIVAGPSIGGLGGLDVRDSGFDAQEDASRFDGASLGGFGTLPLPVELMTALRHAVTLQLLASTGGVLAWDPELIRF